MTFGLVIKCKADMTCGLVIKCKWLFKYIVEIQSLIVMKLRVLFTIWVDVLTSEIAKVKGQIGFRHPQSASHHSLDGS